MKIIHDIAVDMFLWAYHDKRLRRTPALIVSGVAVLAFLVGMALLALPLLPWLVVHP